MEAFAMDIVRVIEVKVLMRRLHAGCSISPPLCFHLHNINGPLWALVCVGGAQRVEVDLRNTGELDLDNTSERTCLL
jgi:hypothetical protein